MYKIYSRKRFLIKPNSLNKNTDKNKSKKIKIIIILIILILVINIMFAYMEPMFETICKQKLKSIATIITNQQSTIIMNKYQYEQLYSIEKDENGNIVIIKSNVVAINNMISDLTECIQNEFNNIESDEINIPMGSLSGIYFLSGIGPNMPTKVYMIGSLDTNIKSEFIAQGINQTLHRVYVNFECDMKIVTPLKSYTSEITNQVIVAEHVIVGNIPETYYNLEGMNSADDTLNMIN